VAEKIFLIANERGIPCNIFRLGLIWADTKRGRYDELQWGYRMIKTSLLAGYGIKNYRYIMAPTAVDYCARAVCFLANRYSQGRGIFHISSSHPMTEGLFERLNETQGASLELVSLYEWGQHIRRLHYAGQTLPEVPLLDSSFSMDEATFNNYQHELESRVLEIDCERTRRELEEADILAPRLTDDLLSKCVKSMLERDHDLLNAFNSGLNVSTAPISKTQR